MLNKSPPIFHHSYLPPLGKQLFNVLNLFALI
uniref:Uncharacterized protein n=1 Tax=Rhizophora mucronata TaxID=61149 RepID=A0A2P2QZ03_RHIMU